MLLLIYRILNPILIFNLLLTLVGVPPQPKRHVPIPADYKGAVNIMLPGVLGYGENGGANPAVPYFGALSGINICDELEARGYPSYTADIGPLSSAWDRACELYAQLTGTRVDYGAAHSEACGHARFGRDYAKPMFPGWSETRPVNLIGHSLGGLTARVFAMLCDEGSASERAATPAKDRSPLFDGGMVNRIHAIVTMGTPHGGSTHFLTMRDDYSLLTRLIDFPWHIGFIALLHLIGNSRLISRFYDLQFDHFNVTHPPAAFGEGLFNDYVWYRSIARLFASRDHALYDLSIDGAAKINEVDKIRPGIRYLSYSESLTLDLFGLHLPSPAAIDPIFSVFALQMGLGVSLMPLPDKAWRETDGAVPLQSSFYPEGQPHKKAPASASATLKPGVWHLMPTVRGDHLYYIGGDLLRHNRRALLDIYLYMMRRIEYTPPKAPKSQPQPAKPPVFK